MMVENTMFTTATIIVNLSFKNSVTISIITNSPITGNLKQHVIGLGS